MESLCNISKENLAEEEALEKAKKKIINLLQYKDYHALSEILSEKLVLVKLQKEANNIYYVLSDCDKKGKVMDATSVEELQCHGKILYISKGQDPPEAIFMEIIRHYLFGNKRSCSNLLKGYIHMVRNGDVQMLKQETFDEVNIKCAFDETGWTMLHHAVYHGNLEILSFLTSIGCDGHVTDSIWSRKPFIIAAREGHTDIIEFFLLQGLSLDETDNMGWTMLHYAAWKGNLEAVRFLIQRKAQIQVQDKCLGKTPVHVAIEEGHLDVVELLVNSGSSIEEESEEGATPLHFAAFEGFLHIVEFLVDRGACLEAGAISYCTPLHFAVHEGHFKIVEFLFDKGADLNAEAKTGCTPLHLATKNGHFKIVEFLVDRGVEIDARDEDGWTSLHYAAEGGHFKVIEFLVDRGSDINVGDKDGWSPLQYATKRGHFKIVEFLVCRGADLNAGDNEGYTPLHHASCKGFLDIVEFLADRGADLTAKSKRGETPLVCGVKHINVTSFLGDKTLKNQIKVDVVNFYKDLLELQKTNLGIVHFETLKTQKKIAEMLYDQCQYSAALDILNDVPYCKRDLCSEDYITLRSKCQLRLLISENKLKYNETEAILKEIFDIEDAHSSTNLKINTFTKTKAIDYKAPLFFNKVVGVRFDILFCLMFSIFLFMLYFYYMLYFAFNNTINK